VLDSLIAEGRALAKTGRRTDALAKFLKAQLLDPKLNLNPENEVLRALDAARFEKTQFEASVKLEAGRTRANAGDINGAVVLFREAKRLDATLALDPEAEAQRVAASAKLREGDVLARQLKIKEAISAYEEAQTIDRTQKVPGRYWNTLCWYGSLAGHPDLVIRACDQAVELTAGLERADYYSRDSRGVARALLAFSSAEGSTRNLSGAIEDFTIYVNKTRDENKRKQRQGWIDALRVGRNPFTPEELKKLLGQ